MHGNIYGAQNVDVFACLGFGFGFRIPTGDPVTAVLSFIAGDRRGGGGTKPSDVSLDVAGCRFACFTIRSRTTRSQAAL